MVPAGYDLKCVSQINMLTSQPPVPQKVSVFEDKVFKEVIELKQGC